jgi:hypothetical protein
MNGSLDWRQRRHHRWLKKLVPRLTWPERDA